MPCACSKSAPISLTCSASGIGPPAVSTVAQVGVCAPGHIIHVSNSRILQWGTLRSAVLVGRASHPRKVLLAVIADMWRLSPSQTRKRLLRGRAGQRPRNCWYRSEYVDLETWHIQVRDRSRSERALDRRSATAVPAPMHSEPRIR